ncbi:MAG: 30S ribosomal protein S12 methylthiotransferase RimO [Mycobacteriales bacterium]
MSAPGSTTRRVALLTLGCARNEVDSEELAGRLAAQGYNVVDAESAEAADAPPEAVLVNTCGFVESAKKDSIDALLAASDSGAKVLAVGCLAERYGAQLAETLPEADAVLGFDDYPQIADRLADVLAGRHIAPHTPRDRRSLLPISPVDRAASSAPVPGHAERPAGLGPASGPPVVRRRLGSAPVAPLKLASGCDRRCTFCAIPQFRGAFRSRRPHELLEEARWLAADGVRELYCVSENSTSYGKDLGDLRLLESLLPELAAVDGIERVRLSYLQPAEMRPGLLRAIAATPGVAPYFDLSFQHASEPVLRRMRRFGNRERFVDLVEQVRAAAPEAGIRTNVIVGFPGETEADVVELERFLSAARLDVVGVFGYSDEDGTEAVGLDGKVDSDEISARVERIDSLVSEISAQRAADRIGTTIEILIEEVDGDTAEGRAAPQAPEVDGSTTLTSVAGIRVGDLVPAVVVDSIGVDLVADARSRS